MDNSKDMVEENSRYGAVEILWVVKVSYEEVLEKLNAKRCLWRIIHKNRRDVAGHILRHVRIMKVIMEGMIELKRPRGRL